MEILKPQSNCREQAISLAISLIDPLVVSVLLLARGTHLTKHEEGSGQ